MLKILLLIMAFCTPMSGYAEELKIVSSPGRLNLELISTNTCASQEAFTRAQDVLSANRPSSVYQHNLCRYEEIRPIWNKGTFIDSEVITWLRLKSAHSNDTRMIGLGFRFQVASFGMAQIRVRGNGGFQVRYQGTFWGF